MYTYLVMFSHLKSSRCKCFLARLRKSVSKFQMFTLFTGRHMLEDQGGPPTWRLNTKLYNFARNISANISHTLNLERGLLYLSSMISHFLNFIHCIVCDFIFYCMTTHTLYRTRLNFQAFALRNMTVAPLSPPGQWPPKKAVAEVKRRVIALDFAY